MKIFVFAFLFHLLVHSSPSHLEDKNILGKPINRNTVGSIQTVPVQYYLLSMACRNGQLGLVKELLGPLNFDPTWNDAEPLRVAAAQGHLEIVKLLMKNQKVDPSTRENQALRMAVSMNHLEVVRFLLKDDRVSPEARGNEAIRLAVRNRNLEMVELLLHDYAVDPSANGYEAVRTAFENRDIEILRVLLSNRMCVCHRGGMYDPDPEDPNWAFLRACRTGDQVQIRFLYLNKLVSRSDELYEALQLVIKTPQLRQLLAEPGVDVVIPENELLVMAVYRGNHSLVQRLLNMDIVDPSVYDNEAFIAAVRSEHYPNVLSLLDHKRVNPAARNNIALRLVAKSGNCYVAKLLLRYSVVDPTVNEYEPLFQAATHGHYSMAELLLADRRVNPFIVFNIARRKGNLLLVQWLFSILRPENFLPVSFPVADEMFRLALRNLPNREQEQK